MNKVTLSGPMFAPSRGEHSSSIFAKDGGHYNISSIHDPDAGYAMLREWFPDAQANSINFVLFSTSGVHGSYMTLEEIEDGLRSVERAEGDAPIDDVTILIVCPRLVCMHYGQCRVSLDNIEFLKRLRASSLAAVQKIGLPEEAQGKEQRP